MSEPGPFAEAIGRIAYAYTQIQPLISTELHIIVAALFPIIAAAHASLSRPASAAKPQIRKKEDDTVDSDDEEEDDDDETFQRMEGFSRSDALWMPLFAGATLTGLYFLIKYLKDLDLLNQVLNWYFSIVGVFSVCKLIADTLGVIHSFFFPKWYTDSKGVWQVRSTMRRTININARNEKDVLSRYSPLPGVLAKLPLPAHVARFLWAVRDIPNNKWSFKFYIHRIAAFRTHIGVFGIVGTVLGLVSTGYYNLVDKPWWLTNLMGFAFSYTSLQLISPTTFDTGALILAGLFVYDIVMVFYTYVPAFPNHHPVLKFSRL
jgi:minor histocompatibility antigen H13